MSQPTEVESPVLHRNACDTFVTGNGYLWACADELENLFEIKDQERICFVAKARGDRHAYKVVLDDLRYWKPDLVKPIRTSLWLSLGAWLKKQVRSGRPHIGVRIIK